MAGSSGDLQFNDGGAPEALAADAKLNWDGTNDELTVDGNIRLGQTAESDDGALDLDMRGESYRTLSITQATSFEVNNEASGRSVTVILVCDGSDHNLTFNASWRFIGPKPTKVTASKIGVLTLYARGAGDANIIATYLEEE